MEEAPGRVTLISPSPPPTAAAVAAAAAHALAPVACRAVLYITSRPPPTLADPDEWSADCISFVTDCLIKDPAHRPSLGRLLDHRFVTEVGRSALREQARAPLRRERHCERCERRPA